MRRESPPTTPTLRSGGAAGPARASGSGHTVIPVLRYQEFNLSYLAAPNTLDIICMDRIPISAYRTIGLTVRVHDINVTTNGFKFIVYGTDPSPSDSRDFVTSSSLGATATISSGTTPFIENLASVISDPQTPFARVVLQAAGLDEGGSLFGIFSADLVCKVS